jgi:hypothetical protein
MCCICANRLLVADCHVGIGTTLHAAPGNGSDRCGQANLREVIRESASVKILALVEAPSVVDPDLEKRRKRLGTLFAFPVGKYAGCREDTEENEMRCSHGVPYEAKCTKCFAEAMAREISRPSMAHAEPSVIRGEHRHNVTFSSVGYVQPARPMMAQV